jgi:hypothetical protein
MRPTSRKLFSLLCIALSLGVRPAGAQESTIISSQVISSKIIKTDGTSMGETVMGETIVGETIVGDSMMEDCCHGPLGTWYVQAGAVILRRNVASSTVFATNPNGTPLVASRDFDFNWVAGPEIQVGRMLNDVLAVEFDFFGLYGMNTSLSEAGIGIPVGSNTLANSFFANYHSSMTNVEINGRYWLSCEMSLLAGFRFVNWHEEMSGGYTIPSTTIINNRLPGVNLPVANGINTPARIVNFADLTNNNLYGVQTGGEWQRSFGRFGVDAYTKLGLYGDQAYGRFGFYNGTANTVSTTQGQAAFLGEMGLFGTFKVNDCITLRAGYSLLWIEGIAIIPQQTNTFSGGPGANSLDAHSGAFLQGFTVGGEVRW